MAESINYGALTKFSDELGSSLISRMFRESTLVKTGINIQTGVKTVERLNVIDDAFTIKPADCVWNPAADINLTNRLVAVNYIENENEFCIPQFETLWLAHTGMEGSNAESLPREFMTSYSAQKIAQASKTMEGLFWRADSAGTFGAKYQFTEGGILSQLTRTSVTASIPAGQKTTGTFTAANAVAKVRGMIAAIPEDILDADNLRMYVSQIDYATIQNALLDSNNFHYGTEMTQGPKVGEFRFPGSDVWITRQNMPVSYAIISRAANFYLATDLMNDFETLRVWYNEDQDQVRTRIKFKVGGAVLFAGEVVINTPA